MSGTGKLQGLVVGLVVLVLAGCAAGDPKVAAREKQQALIRQLSDECVEGHLQACSRVTEEKRILFDVYGCHCKDSQPPGHKEIPPKP